MADDVSSAETQSLLPPFTAYHGDEAYIFVSYSHKDKAAVYAELARLHTEGYRLWYDEGIVLGEDWTEMVETALGNCAIFLVFLSPQAMESENVKDEVHCAGDFQKKRLAVYLEATVLPRGQHLRMSRIQTINKYELPEAMYRQKLQEALPAMTRVADVTPPPSSPPPLPVDTRVRNTLTTAPEGTSVSPTHNLPSLFTSFIGRTAKITSLLNLLEDASNASDYPAWTRRHRQNAAGVGSRRTLHRAGGNALPRWHLVPSPGGPAAGRRHPAGDLRDAEDSGDRGPGGGKAVVRSAR